MFAALDFLILLKRTMINFHLHDVNSTHQNLAPFDVITQRSGAVQNIFQPKILGLSLHNRSFCIHLIANLYTMTMYGRY